MSEVKTRESIEFYENDSASKAEYQKNFEIYYWGIALCFFAYCLSIISGGVAFWSAVLIGLVIQLTAVNTPVVCSKCRGIMHRYDYMDERYDHDYPGAVYLCLFCKRKFLYSDSRKKSSGGDGGGG